MTSTEQRIAEALAHHQAGRIADAQAGYRDVLQKEPDNPDALHLLGVLGAQCGHPKDALELLDRALKSAPNNAGIHANRGNILRQLGELDQAVAAYRRALELQPMDAEIYVNLASVQRDLGQLDDAIAAYEWALRLEADHPDLLANYAGALAEAGRHAEALDLFARSIAPDGESAETRAGAADTLLQLGRVDEAIDQYIAAVERNPALHTAGSNLLFALHHRVTTDARWLFEQHRNWAERYASPLAAKIHPHENDRNPDRRLRIGYVGSVLPQVRPVIESHDPAQLKVFTYAQSTGDVAKMTDDQLADLIRSQQIDILIDLAGHSPGNRLLAFAQKPAPVQLTWLGYPNTTGLSAIDYRITDATLDPPGESDQLSVEKLLRPGGCFLCLDPQAAPIEATSTHNTFTFGCFNNFAKASPEVLKLWARILQQVPTARLLLKSPNLASPAAIDHARDMLTANGLPLDRVGLASHVEFDRHLAGYNDIDLALDTYPFGGRATTCDALSMGVPVLTLPGRTTASRLSASILTSANLAQSIAADEDAYVNLAVDAANQGKRSTDQRLALRDQVRASPLCDVQNFTRRLESVYRQIWRTWCAQASA